MRRPRSALLSIAIAVILSSLLTPPTATAAAGEVVKRRLVTAIEKLPGAAETRSGYDREKFRHWVDADGDCRDTRDEVLAAESLVSVSGCDIQTGKWRSSYDGATTRDSTAFDIDHMVALAEAWDSGAKRWNADTRERFANDLRDPRTLVAVSASANRSKSDQDPADWLPVLGKCRYLRQWVAVKTRWHLTVNPAERRALRSQAADCGNGVIEVRRATVRIASSSGHHGNSGGLDPRYDYCYQAQAAGYGPYHQGQDPEYEWYTDGDSDGIACE
jgi:hypothetical protein